MMTKTIFITGASSGIGRATAQYFADKGWQVAASMRHPESDVHLAQHPNIRLFRLDVTDAASIQYAIDKAIEAFGRIDVLVNNAGYGAFGAFEAASEEQVFRQIDTNIIGLMRVTRAMLPHFRQHHAGVIINLSSIAGRLASPLFSLYNATKFAVEGFSDALHYELKPLGIQVKLVEPGPIKTEFNGRSKDESDLRKYPVYQSYTDKVTRVYEKMFATAPEPVVVAKTIYKAAHSGGFRLRFASGTQGKMIILMSKLIPAWKMRFLQRWMASF